MTYWKGLMIAAAIDLIWIMGTPGKAMGPGPVQPPAMEYTVAELERTGNLEDSLMLHLQSHPEDVTAMAKLADVYMEHEWYDAAIGPLARALQLDPTRRSLWVMLDKAVAKSGTGKITDAELVERAADFLETVRMWGTAVNC